VSGKMPCHISDGPRHPDEDAEYYDPALEDQIAEDQARQLAQGALCAVCCKKYVDVLAGEDTCPDCVDTLTTNGGIQ